MSLHEVVGWRGRWKFPRPCLRRLCGLWAHVEDPVAVNRPGVAKSLLPPHAAQGNSPRDRCCALSSQRLHDRTSQIAYLEASPVPIRRISTTQLRATTSALEPSSRPLGREARTVGSDVGQPTSRLMRSPFGVSALGQCLRVRARRSSRPARTRSGVTSGRRWASPGMMWAGSGRKPRMSLTTQ